VDTVSLDASSSTTFFTHTWVDSVSNSFQLGKGDVSGSDH
jgi:hypothetical protein